MRHYGSFGLIIAALAFGDRIAFKATVTPSDRDPKFGFFSQPAKARVISKKEGAREAGLTLIGVQVLP